MQILLIVLNKLVIDVNVANCISYQNQEKKKKTKFLKSLVHDTTLKFQGFL